MLVSLTSFKDCVIAKERAIAAKTSGADHIEIEYKQLEM
jgi:hypothetical protein